MTSQTSEIAPNNLRLVPDDASDASALDAVVLSGDGIAAGASSAPAGLVRPIASAPSDERPPLTAGRIVTLVVGWSLLLVVATAAVAYPLGPLFEQRAQHRSLRKLRTEIYEAANSTEGLAGVLGETTPAAPATGDPVAILDVGGLHLRQVVIEGSSAAQTSNGPGHVPGTAGLGQPGNAVIIGRRAAWGGPFGSIDQLRTGERIVVTTTQGQSVYRVTHVRRGARSAPAFAPTDDDRLTLVTSSSSLPWASRSSSVVVAEIVGRPFEPTPQRGREARTGHIGGDTGGLAQLVLVLGAFAWVAWQTTSDHRRWRPLTAYLLTTPALVVLALLVAESLTRLLPQWA